MEDVVTSETVEANAQRIAELITDICDALLETSSAVPKLVQAIDSLHTLLKTISSFCLPSQFYSLDITMEVSPARKELVSLRIDSRIHGVHARTSLTSYQASTTDWDHYKSKVTVENPDSNSIANVLLIAETIASNMDKIIEWLQSVLEDIRQRNSVLLGYADTISRVMSDPEITKLLVLNMTSRP